LMLNHEFCTAGAKLPLDEFGSETGESIAVGNHNFLDFSSIRAVQNGEKTLAFEVDAARDVADDDVVWKIRPHCCDLAVEIISLLCGADSAVAESFPRPFCVGLFIGYVVSALSTGSRSEVEDARVAPGDQSPLVAFVMFGGGS